MQVVRMMALSEQEIFINALPLSAAARAEYLIEVCQGDVTLLQRLEELLRLHDHPSSVLDRQPVEMMESLGGASEVSDVRPQEHPAAILAGLKPFLDPASQPQHVGRLAHFELLEVLGHGGNGIVFKAWDTKLHRLVALKILLPHLAVTSPARRRFLREARAAAAVRHENVVQIYAVEEAPIPHLVMEFVSGETLQQRSDRTGPFDVADILRLGVQIARGLAAAHAQGLIHRDIKPGNILIEEGIEPRAKLSDFGLARAADDASASQSGFVAGTPMYMSPEQVHGDEVDQRTDLFSFGSVLYLLVTGRPPFRAPSTLAVLKRVAEDAPRPIRQVIPETPQGLCEVISRLQDKVRDRRYNSASQAADALANCLNLRPKTPTERLFQSRAAAVAVVLILLSAVAMLLSGSFPGETPVRNSLASSSDTPRAGQAVKAKPVTLEPAPKPDVAGPPGRAADSLGQSAPMAETLTSSPKASSETKSVSPEPAPQSKPEVEPDPDALLSGWDKGVALMTPEDQFATVRGKLIELNPGLSADSFRVEIKNDAVEGLRIEPSQALAILTPLRSLRKLKRLSMLNGGKVTDLTPLKGLQLEFLEAVCHPISDLTPLKGMPLKYFGFWNWEGNDLSVLKGMPLTGGNFGGSKIHDLEPLRGMRLEYACFNYTSVSDLSPLKGMPLRRLEIQNTKISDLSPLQGAPLQMLAAASSPIKDFSPIKQAPLTELWLDYDPERDGAILRALPGLEKVNGRPVEELLEK